MFLVRAGRTISVWFAWPEGPQTKGAVRVRIDTGKKRWRMDGDLTTEEQNGKPAVYFMQNDFGMSDRKAKMGQPDPALQPVHRRPDDRQRDCHHHQAGGDQTARRRYSRCTSADAIVMVTPPCRNEPAS